MSSVCQVCAEVSAVCDRPLARTNTCSLESAARRLPSTAEGGTCAATRPRRNRRSRSSSNAPVRASSSSMPLNIHSCAPGARRGQSPARLQRHDDRARSRRRVPRRGVPISPPGRPSPRKTQTPEMPPQRTRLQGARGLRPTRQRPPRHRHRRRDSGSRPRGSQTRSPGRSTARSLHWRASRARPSPS